MESESLIFTGLEIPRDYFRERRENDDLYTYFILCIDPCGFLMFL